MTIWTPERQALAIAEAHSWIGTRWRHWQSVKGRGVDCVHFVVAVVRAAGLLPDTFTVPSYARNVGMWEKSDGIADAIRACPGVMVANVSLDAVEFGDVLVFQDGDCSSHVAILLADGLLWHSLSGTGVVNGQFKFWRSRLKEAFRITQI